MSPLEFLDEEIENVQQALDETLRHDYGPRRSLQFYKECEGRLQIFRQMRAELDVKAPEKIAGLMQRIKTLAHRIFLIERSHLGEFSWFFEHELEELARWLLTEKHAKGHMVEPLTHIAGEGTTYRILPETASAAMPDRKLVIIVFPSRLRHHVLLHSLFGHELCHAALRTQNVGGEIARAVYDKLKESAVLKNVAGFNTWCNDSSAPNVHRQVVQKEPIQLTEKIRSSWLVELACDLFGLALFGPSFFAAFRAYLGTTSDVYEVRRASTNELLVHPPFAVRLKLLNLAMRAFGWDKPIAAAGKATFAAEQKLLDFLMEDSYSPWAQFFTPDQVGGACTAVQQLLSRANRQYKPLEAATLEHLVLSLSNANPPVVSHVDASGAPEMKSLELAQILYAGWVFWEGREQFPDRRLKRFIDVNRMCDLALGQNAAIVSVLKHRAA